MTHQRGEGVEASAGMGNQSSGEVIECCVIMKIGQAHPQKTLPHRHAGWANGWYEKASFCQTGRRGHRVGGVADDDRNNLSLRCP